MLVENRKFHLLWYLWKQPKRCVPKNSFQKMSFKYITVMEYTCNFENQIFV